MSSYSYLLCTKHPKHTFKLIQSKIPFGSDLTVLKGMCMQKNLKKVTEQFFRYRYPWPTTIGERCWNFSKSLCLEHKNTKNTFNLIQSKIPFGSDLTVLKDTCMLKIRKSYWTVLEKPTGIKLLYGRNAKIFQSPDVWNTKTPKTHI